MKAIILARVSSKEQQEGYSIQTQTEQLTQYCLRKNFQVLETFQIVESSTRGDRKDFKAMLKFAEDQSETIALITSNVDRLQRSFREYSLIDGLIQDEKIEIHFINENKIINKDSSSSDKLMWNIGIAVAQNYTDVLSEKVKGALHTKRENGEWTSKAPIGYKNHRDELTGKNSIILDKERAFLVKRIFVEYSTGSYSLSEIAKISKEWGLRNNYKAQKPLSTSQLHRLIQNPFYYGEMRVMGKLFRHIYPPIIDKHTWDKCQEIRTGRSRTKTPRQTNKPFIFRGLIKCATTGRVVTSDIKKGKFVYLITRDPKNPEKKVYVPEKQVLEGIRAVFQSIKIEDEILESITEHLKQSHESEKTYQKNAIKDLQVESNKIQNKLDRLLDLFIDKSITADEYDRKCHQLKSRQYQINDQ
ncbi:MAG: recombinase family protein, partial [Thermodesulfobacteriota bacterium]